MATGQAEPAHFTAHRRVGAVNPGVGAQPHQVVPARLPLKPAGQLRTGEGSIGQHGDRVDPESRWSARSSRTITTAALTLALGCSSVCQSNGTAR
jgi:hypothetical protein